MISINTLLYNACKKSFIKVSFTVFLSLLFITKTSAQNKTVTRSGDVLATLIPASALASTFIWKSNDKPIWQFAKSYGSAIFLEEALKHIVQKPRPDGSDNLSFPSGHTTSAFSGASFIQKRYGWKYGIPSYVLASYVGYTRIQAKKHDGWDVLAGATIGIGTSYLFSKPYLNNKVDVSLQKTDNGYLLGLHYTF